MLVCSILFCIFIAAVPLYGRWGAVGLVIWFLTSVFFVIGFLFCLGWVFFPLLLLLLYGGAVSIVIVAGFFVIFEEQDRSVAKNRIVGSRFFWAAFVGCSSVGLVCLSALWTHLSIWRGVGLFRERTGQALVRYYLFYSPDIQCYSALLVGFDFIFILLGLILWVVTILFGFVTRE